MTTNNNLNYNIINQIIYNYCLESNKLTFEELNNLFDELYKEFKKCGKELSLTLKEDNNSIKQLNDIQNNNEYIFINALTDDYIGIHNIKSLEVILKINGLGSHYMFERNINTNLYDIKLITFKKINKGLKNKVKLDFKGNFNIK